ncbi:hypothetical protein Y032_0003g1592 [Ancylostoma ceylanicum]|uniref:Uncharacterized protein n=1 Tax=Ancylostoma ceylanicum TaxID=53326 RepID=A0A016W0C7_9BILA|nr:hypothetical protein Y032_0003g1592 [Ancylostoma ceylanicum]
MQLSSLAWPISPQEIWATDPRSASKTEYGSTHPITNVHGHQVSFPLGVNGGDSSAAKKSTRHERAAQDGLAAAVANLGFLDSCSSHSMGLAKTCLLRLRNTLNTNMTTISGEGIDLLILSIFFFQFSIGDGQGHVYWCSPMS